MENRPMSPELAQRRRESISKTFEAMKPLLQFVAHRQMYRDGVMLDIGTGEGIIALEMAKEFGVSKVFLTDIKKYLLVELPSNAVFQILDVCGGDFVKRFQNKVTLVTCLKTFHEFADPFQAAVNLISVLPLRGMVFIMDHTEEGWDYLRRTAMDEGLGAQFHHEQDMERIRKSGLHLDTDEGIRDFWETWFFPRVPGECHLTFHGLMYSTVYIARQWGEVKPFPG